MGKIGVLIFPFFLVQNMYSQFFYSIDKTADPRSIAMGESFVAFPNGLLSIEHNPATLAKVKQITVHFAFRDLKWLDLIQSFNIMSFGIALPTEYGVFGLSYKRFTLGEYFHTENNPVPVATFNQIERTIAASYAVELLDDFFIGLNVKAYNEGIDVLSGNYDLPDSKVALLGDIGVLYSIPGVVFTQSFSDELSLGVSLQNYGTDLKIPQPQADKSYVFAAEKVPRYVRGGFSYTVSSHFSNDISEVGVSISAEYRKYLNPHFFEEDQTDFWGLGAELAIYDLVFIRGGGVVYPYTSILGEKEKLTGRYGFGLRIVPQRFGISIPAVLLIDYASQYVPTAVVGARRQLPSFGIQLSHEISSN